MLNNDRVEFKDDVEYDLGNETFIIYENDDLIAEVEDELPLRVAIWDKEGDISYYTPINVKDIKKLRSDEDE